MKIIRSIQAIQKVIKRYKRRGKTIGLVPTMGYLHDGHLSLIKAACRDCDIVAMSIFVNPLQFGPKEDFKKYPRNLKRDESLAKSAGVDIIFYPSAQAMYPDNFKTYVDVQKITARLCGAFRPGHFKGVATVVIKLFNIVMPDIAYFGQKDAQQAIVIQRMVEDLNTPIKIKVMPIVREPDGLAMSSRNVYLSRSQRAQAAVLFNSLQAARRMVQLGTLDGRRIISKIRSLINAKSEVTKIDYVEAVDLKNLEPVKKIKGKCLIALAVWFGKTRLIDNIVVDGK